ncbi:MAG: T9SS type A sorting domain-containing protein [bacterium]
MKKIIVLIIGLSLFIGSSSPKETVTWTGAGDKYWDNPQNWSNGKIPSQNDDVVIPKGSPTCVYGNHHTNINTYLFSKSIRNEGELVVETVNVQTHKFENTQDGNVTVTESTTIGLLDGVTEFVNEGSISGKKLEVKGSNEYTSTFTNNGTISTTYLGVENCSEVSNTSEGTISGSIIICNHMNSNSVVTNSGNMTAGSTGSIIITSGSFTNTQTGNMKTGDHFGVQCENNVVLAGTAASSPNNGGDVYIKANNVEITGTVESGNSEYGHGGNFTITSKNNVWIDGTVKAGDCENSDAGNVWINAGNSLFASKNSQITAGSASYSEYAKDGKVKISAKSSTIMGKVSAGSSGKKTTIPYKPELTQLNNSISKLDKEVYFNNITIAADSIIVEGDSVKISADTLKIMGNYIKFSDNPGFGFIYVDELLIIQTPPGGTVDFSGRQDIEDFTGGLNYKIKIFSDNIIPPAGGFSQNWPPEMYPSDVSITDGYISETTVTDSAGSSGTFELIIQNQSMAAKTFNVGITSVLGWVAETQTTTSELQPFEFTTLLLNYSIPVNGDTLTDEVTVELSVPGLFTSKSVSYITSYPTNITSVRESSEIPVTFMLHQNYPNPFNPSTTIQYSIPGVETPYMASLQHVTLKVYDVLGREVKTLVNETQNPGNYEVTFDAANFASGVYFFRIEAYDFVDVKKMLLIK